MTSLRVRWVAAVAAYAFLLPAAPASGHSAFVGSEPEPGTRLEEAPQRVVLNFTEPLNRRLSRAALVDAKGKEIAVEAQAASDRRLILRPAGLLQTGAYQVRWHTVSTEDGHALEGSFSFGVRALAVGGEHDVEQSPFARDGWLRVALRAALYAFMLIFVASLLVPRLVRATPSWLAPSALERAGVDTAAVRARERRVVNDAGWLAVAAAVGTTLAEAADAAGGLSPSGVADFVLSGSAGASRLAVVVALLAAAAVASRRPRWAAAAAVLALWGVAASGHASSATPRAPSILNDWLHLLSGAVWLGGIAVLVIVWTPALRRGGRPLRQSVAGHVLPAFGRVALPAFVLVVMTGLVSLVTQLGHLEALWRTDYGRVLLVKIGLVGLVALASAVHVWRLRPQLLRERDPRAAVDRRHWRLVRAEPVVGLGVVMAVAVLVAFPLPPRQLADADEAAAAAPACDPCPLPKPKADELPVAEQAGSRLVAGWVRRAGGQVAGTVRALDIEGQPIRAPFEVLGARQAGCGRGCRRFSLPAADTVRVAVTDRGRRYVAALPATWHQQGTSEARRILARAQRTMRSLRSVREVQEVTSGPGSYARTIYRLRAPQRMSYTTSADSRAVVLGERQWFRAPGTTRWIRSSYGSGIPFSVRSWFRWTTYATAVRLLRRGREPGGRVTELALMDPATPVWLRLVIDDRTHRVVRERMIATGHFMHSRYTAFNTPLSIEAPRGD